MTETPIDRIREFSFEWAGLWVRCFAVLYLWVGCVRSFDARPLLAAISFGILALVALRTFFVRDPLGDAPMGFVSVAFALNVAYLYVPTHLIYRREAYGLLLSVIVLLVGCKVIGPIARSPEASWGKTLLASGVIHALTLTWTA